MGTNDPNGKRGAVLTFPTLIIVKLDSFEMRLDEAQLNQGYIIAFSNTKVLKKFNSGIASTKNMVIHSSM